MKPGIDAAVAPGAAANRPRKGAAQLKRIGDLAMDMREYPNRSRKGAAQLKPAQRRATIIRRRAIS